MRPPLLILTHEYPPRHGGIATYVAETARAAAQAGWAVTVAAPRYAVATEEPGLRVLPTPVHGTQDWTDRWRMRRWLGQQNFAWSDTTLWLPEPGPLRLWLYAREFNLPRPERLVLTFHGSEVLLLRRLGYRRRRLRALLGQASVVSVVSNSVAAMLRSVAPRIALGPLAIVPGGVRSDLLAALDPASRKPTQREEPYRLLTVGRVHPRKGQLQVVEALGLLPDALRAQVIYTPIGPVRRSNYAALLSRRARELGVQLEAPREAATPEDLARAYATADLFVLASETRAHSTEGFGLVLLEAAAAGCPVVGTDSGGMREAMGPKNGAVVPAGKASALAVTIEQLLLDPSRREAMGAAGPAWAQRFSWSANAEKLFGPPPRLRP